MQLPVDFEQIGQGCIMDCDKDGVFKALVESVVIFEGNVLVEVAVDVVADFARKSQ